MYNILIQMVRIKNGDEVTGLLDNIDTFMNLKLKDVTYIANGEEVSYWKMTEIYIRGNNIASINLKEGLLEKLEEEKELAITVPQITTQKVNTVPTRGGGITRGRGMPLSNIY